MPKTITEWMQDGEELYTLTSADCREMETQLAEATKRLAEKKSEATRIARAIGKPVADESAPGTTNRLRMFGWVAAIVGTVGVIFWLVASGYRP